MNFKKKILSIIGLVFIVIQFIRPIHNKDDRQSATDISKILSVSDTVQAILINACYDCHSNNTNYPWYSNIQPIGWLIASHIKKGKDALTFSEFGNYSTRRQISKLTGMINSLNDNIMPLSSFKLMHKNAQLAATEKMQLILWAQQAREYLSSKY